MGQLGPQPHQCQLSIMPFLMRVMTKEGKSLPGCEVEQKLHVWQHRPTGGSTTVEADSAMEVWTLFFGKWGAGRLLAAFIPLVLEKKQPVTSAVQDWPFAVVPRGAGGSWWYRGTAPSDHQAGVLLSCSIPGVKPRGDFVSSAGKVTLHIFLKLTFFVCSSSRVPYWPVHTSTSLCPLFCPNPFSPGSCWDPWSRPLAKVQGERPSA